MHQPRSSKTSWCFLQPLAIGSCQPVQGSGKGGKGKGWAQRLGRFVLLKVENPGGSLLLGHLI